MSPPGSPDDFIALHIKQFKAAQCQPRGGRLDSVTNVKVTGSPGTFQNVKQFGKTKRFSACLKCKLFILMGSFRSH